MVFGKEASLKKENLRKKLDQDKCLNNEWQYNFNCITSITHGKC